MNELSQVNVMGVVYDDTLKDLKAAIDQKFGSLAECSRVCKIDRHNLSRLFSQENPREMSISTFVIICNGLGLLKADAVPLEMRRSKISLKQYLEIDNNAIMRNLLLIRFM
jgi:hypothetical protein